ncbi:MAG: hypothetical protein KF770_27885 [Anaerolineae bacterium]|nr:hypothetical protein [Anaerolineae bacterium]
MDSLPTTIDPNQLRCEQCHRQLGKEAIACQNRPQGACFYDLDDRQGIMWSQVVGGSVVAFFLFLGAAFTVIAYDSFFTIPGLLLGGLCLLILFASLNYLFKRLVRLQHRSTGETWQQIPNVGLFYAPTASVPDCMKNPPAMTRPLTYPASAVALFDGRFANMWEQPSPDVPFEHLAYVWLATVLSLVSQGAIIIGYMPTYARPLWSKTISRMPNQDFYVQITEAGKTAQVNGRLEQFILKQAKEWPHSRVNVYKWQPGPSLMQLRPSHKNSKRRSKPIPDREQFERRSMLRNLLRDAGRLGLVRQNGRILTPTPDLEPLLRQEAESLAALVRAFEAQDPALITAVTQQTVAVLNSFDFAAQYTGWFLKRGQSPQ